MRVATPLISALDEHRLLAVVKVRRVAPRRIDPCGKAGVSIVSEPLALLKRC